MSLVKLSMVVCEAEVSLVNRDDVLSLKYQGFITLTFIYKGLRLKKKKVELRFSSL